jgi:hypothetical protein
LVAASAVVALFTLASALYTAACADATVPAGDVVLLELPVPVELVPAEPDPVEPPPADGAVVVVVGGGVTVGAVVVLGVVVVAVWVVCGAGVVVVVVVVCVFGVAAVVLVAVGTVLAADTNSVVPEPDLVSRLAVVVDVELVSAVLSWSCAAVRFCSAWSSESCAEVESSVASSWPLVTC